MSYVFVSYAREDTAFVERLVKDLVADNLPIWFDQQNIEPGENWDAAVEQALQMATVVLVVVSPASMVSDNVRNDINFARDADQRIVPILYRYAPLILNLQTLNWVDLSSEVLYAENRPELAAFLGQQLDQQVAPLAEKVAFARDTRQVSPVELRGYLQILAVIGAPLSDAPGEGPPRRYLDHANEWRLLVDAIRVSTQLQAATDYIPLAITRLIPATESYLRDLLGDSAPDGPQIVHLIANTNGDTVDLEDEWGRTAAVFAQGLINLFKPSAVELLVLHSHLSPETIQFLLEETPLRAVVSVQDLVPVEVGSYFNRRFYGRLAAGESVRDAFETARADLQVSMGDEAEQFALSLQPGHDDVYLTVPAPEMRGPGTLINPGTPPLLNVPVNLGFVGQRAALIELSQEIASTDFRQIAIYGAAGIGKSWLAAEYVARSAWRYPDGVIWMRIAPGSKSEDVIGQILALLELPATTNWATLRDILRDRQVLIVLDQVAEWGDPLEIGELADFISRLNNIGGTRILITARGPVQPLTSTSGTEENMLEEMAPDEAEILVHHLLERHDLHDVFSGDAQIQAFLEKTLYVPWLIHEAIRLIHLQGLEATLDDLDDLLSDVSDAYEYYMFSQFERLPDGPRELLRKLRGLPDAFDRALVQKIGGEDAIVNLRELVRYSVVRQEHGLYRIQPLVRSLLQDYTLLGDEEQDRIDEIVILHLLSQAARTNG
ncbi:MAG: TIR domain-containing protein [Chloroflexi bacterium]|nr:TIR domain-containing protein [Chloroflexota bacterium]